MKNIYMKLWLVCNVFILFFTSHNLYAQPPSTPVTPMATTDGMVSCVVRSGNTIYIGGSFMMVRNPDNSIAFRNYIAAIDATTGFVTSWNPNPDGPVITMALAGNLLYVGGDFWNIGGKVRYYIAALKTDTDYFIANDWNPGAYGIVNKIIVSGTNVYCAGGFTYIGGKSRNGLAALTTMLDGNNATSWNPSPDGEVNDILLIGNKLYVAGSFMFIGGQSRNNIAAVNVSDSNATSWNPNANNTVMAISSLGNTLYAAGSFTSIGGQSRVRIAALNMLINTNNATLWNPDVNGRINSIKAFDGRVYVGGTFSLVNGQSRNNIASLTVSPNTNNTSSWNPILDSYVDKINIQDSIIFVGGNFLTVNGLSRPHFAMFQPVLPTLTTTVVSNITVNSAVSGGNITADGGPPVIKRGVCWSLIPNPTIQDDTTINGSGIGSFTSIMTGLSIYTNYKVRAYATSAIGTAYGNEISFYTLPAVYTGDMASNQFCVGDSVIIPYEATPGFEDANYFIAQLSDHLGSFANPVVLSSINSKESGEIHTRIPLNTIYGISYRFRVVATQPSSTLKDNSIDILINELPDVSLSTFPDICSDYSTMDLIGGSPAGGTYSGKGVTNNQFFASVAGVGSHTITYTYSDGFGCYNRARATIKVNSIPVVSIQIQPDICIDALPINLSGGTPTGGIYSGSGINGSTFNPKTAGIGKHTITYSYTDPNGCVNSDSADINVNTLPVVSLAAINDVCLNTAPFQLTGGTPGGGNYTGIGVNNNEFGPSIAGVGTHVIQYTYTDNKGCTDSATNTIKVKSIPPKPVVTQVDYRTLSSSSESGNQWYLNGIIMPNDTSKILHPKASARYTVLVTGENGCLSDISDEFIFHNLAVDDLDLADKISIYPNPADEIFFIQIDSEYISQLYVSVNNLLGEKIISKIISGIYGKRIEKINTQLLTDGIYILNITVGNESFTQKIIIRK